MGYFGGWFDIIFYRLMEITSDGETFPAGPSLSHPMGLDSLGRDKNHAERGSKHAFLAYSTQGCPTVI